MGVHRPVGVLCLVAVRPAGEQFLVIVVVLIAAVVRRRNTIVVGILILVGGTNDAEQVGNGVAEAFPLAERQAMRMELGLVLGGGTL